MLAVGGERAAAEGLDNLEFVECDAEELTFEKASFDAVLSRQGLQFLPDVAGVLARLHAFLKPHGRLAAAVWGPPGTVQFAAPVPVIRAELELPPPPAGVPGPFALADAAQLAGAGRGRRLHRRGNRHRDRDLRDRLARAGDPVAARRRTADQLAGRRPTVRGPGARMGKRSPRRGGRTPPPTAGCGSRMRRSG